jgi:hypothetical protein
MFAVKNNFNNFVESVPRDEKLHITFSEAMDLLKRFGLKKNANEKINLKKVSRNKTNEFDSRFEKVLIVFSQKTFPSVRLFSMP